MLLYFLDEFSITILFNGAKLFLIFAKTCAFMYVMITSSGTFYLEGRMANFDPYSTENPPSNAELFTIARGGGNPFSRRPDFRYLVAAWYFKRGVTPNQLAWSRLQWAPVVGLAVGACLIAPAGWPQYMLLAAVLTIATPVWLWDLWDGPLAVIGQLRELSVRRRKFVTRSPTGELMFDTKPHLELEVEQLLTWKERLRLSGVTHTGETIDPAADKALFASVHLALLTVYTSAWPLVIASILAEALLFAARPIKDRLRLNAKAASIYGKIKVHIQWTHQLILLVMAIGTNNHWWQVDSSTLMLAGFCLLGHTLLWSLLSIGSHIWSGYKAWPTRGAHDRIINRPPASHTETRQRPKLRVVRTNDDSNKA